MLTMINNVEDILGGVGDTHGTNGEKQAQHGGRLKITSWRHDVPPQKFIAVYGNV